MNAKEKFIECLVSKELLGPTHGFDKLEEKILDEMLEPTCGVCPHMECDHCPFNI